MLYNGYVGKLLGGRYMKKRKTILLIIVAAVCVGLAVLISINRDPNGAFAKIFGFELPDSVKFIAYGYYQSSDNLAAKILISNNDVDTIRQGLNNYFGGEMSTKHEEYYWGNGYSWWDLDENNVISRYYTMVDRKVGLAITSSKVWVFLTKNDDGQYYLYIDKY
jgi:hypothetical protein